MRQEAAEHAKTASGKGTRTPVDPFGNGGCHEFPMTHVVMHRVALLVIGTVCLGTTPKNILNINDAIITRRGDREPRGGARSQQGPEERAAQHAQRAQARPCEAQGAPTGPRRPQQAHLRSVGTLHLNVSRCCDIASRATRLSVVRVPV